MMLLKKMQAEVYDQSRNLSKNQSFCTDIIFGIKKYSLSYLIYILLIFSDL